MASSSSLGHGGDEVAEYVMQFKLGESNEAKELLSQDYNTAIKIGQKHIFDKIILDLDPPTPPRFEVVQCGDVGFMATIKLDVSDLPSARGESIWISVVEGETMSSRAAAEESAIKKCFKVLQKDHLVSIVDFSSMLIKTIESNNTHELLDESIVALEHVLVQWDTALEKSESFVTNLENQVSEDNIYAPRTARGHVYASLADFVSDIHNTFYVKTNEVKSALVDTKSALERFEKIREDKGKTHQSGHAPRQTCLPAKYILDYMCFFKHDSPQYVSSPEAHGFVTSNVTFELPLLDNFQFGGKITLEGKSYTSAQADEDAAFQALVFIEKNFNTKVIDYNYSKRKRALKEENILLSSIEKTIHLAESLKVLFGEFIHGIEGCRRRFRLDPTSLFAGHMSAGQIDAYRFCCTCLAELDEYSTKCYESCADHFDVLNKLSWKVLCLKTSGLM